jgi:signal transduction histidine kinase
MWLAITQEQGELTVDVRDDGVGGAQIEATSDASGLRGLRDRVEALGGTFVVESSPGRGTRLVARFPLGTNGAVE